MSGWWTSRARQGVQDLLLARRTGRAGDLATPGVEHQRGRGPQDPEPTYEVEVVLGVDLEVLDPGDDRCDLRQGPSGRSAGCAERRRELQERGLLAEGGVRDRGEHVGPGVFETDPAAFLNHRGLGDRERVRAAEAAVGQQPVEAEAEAEDDGGADDPGSTAHVRATVAATATFRRC